MAKKCYLKCLEDSHPPILLPPNEEVFLGRGKITKISNVACSRRQLSLKANYEDFNVELKQIGSNISGLNGFGIQRSKIYKIDHDSKVEILFGQYIHNIEFEPPPQEPADILYSKKRKLDCPEGNSSKIFKMITDTNMALENKWDCMCKSELYVFTSKGTRGSCKIAAFDMDGTLIKTISGKVHPVDTNDWKLAFPTIRTKLKDHVDRGYKIVILTNQAPIGKGTVKIDDFKIKMEKIVEKLEVPVQAFIATGKTIYRKPAIGMWKILMEKKNDDIQIDIAQSFYCGDAAGRAANWAPGKSKDHSMADKLMAENLGLTFFTPEQFFLDHSISNIPFLKPDFSPQDLADGKFNSNLINKDLEVLVLVGYPGSGKSFIAKQIVDKTNGKYLSVCRDTLGQWQKCIKLAGNYLKNGKSVVVDSTNPDIESRSRWISLAKENKVVCRCALMTTSFAHARHNNKFRELLNVKHAPVNDIIFYGYRKKFVEPTINEGFSEVLKVDFTPHFENEDWKKLYKMHLLEK